MKLSISRPILFYVLPEFFTKWTALDGRSIRALLRHSSPNTCQIAATYDDLKLFVTWCRTRRHERTDRPQHSGKSRVAMPSPVISRSRMSSGVYCYSILIIGLNNYIWTLFFQDCFYLEPFLPGPFLPDPFTGTVFTRTVITYTPAPFLTPFDACGILYPT